MKTLVVASALVLLSTVAWVAGQVPTLGVCPKQSVLQGFRAAEYLGKWYEQEKYFAIFQAGGKCATAVYTDQGNGVVGVNNAQISTSNGSRSSIQGNARLAGTSGEAKLVVRFPSNGNFPAPYWVLDSDYTSYSIVWSCTGFLSLANAQFMWVLTREKNPSAALMTNIRNIIKQRKLDTSRLQKTLQDCNN